MKDKHSLLKRQLRRFFGDTAVPGELEDFINSVDTAYREFDIEREMLERSLELSSQEMLQINAEMRALLHAIPDMFFVIDEKGIIIDHKAISPGDTYFTGESLLLGKSILNIPVPDIGQKFRCARDIIEQGETLVAIEYNFPVNGVRNYYEARIAPVIENRYIVIIRNITERIIAEENLRKEMDFTHTLVQSSPAFFIAIKPQGKIIMMNNAMLNALEYTLDETVAADFISTFIPDPGKNEIAETINELITYKNLLVREWNFLTKSGNELLIEWHIRPVLKKGGSVDFIFGVGIDITGRKRLENQLNQAQKMEAIGTLAGGVAHDFNNLLMGIQGRASLMLMDLDSSNPHYEHLLEIEHYVKRASDLTMQLLGLARGGKYEVKPANINDIIRKSAGMFGRTRKEVVIDYNFETGCWTVEVDQGQIEQVLLNLFLNASQAMPEGGRLFISTENVILEETDVIPYEIMPGKFVKTCVTDTGIGMDKNTMKRIFDPFFTTKEPGRGTGLGLPSAYGIIKNHDGTINVYSEKGRGTTFTFYLPASDKHIPAEKTSPEKFVKGNENILLVDDEEMNLYIGREMISMMGYNAVTAQNGYEAITLYKQDPGSFDLVVLDMIMPEMSGRETFLSLKKINPEVKVLLSSGYSIDGQAKEILNQGCKAFIQKPFTIRELSRKLREILD